MDVVVVNVVGMLEGNLGNGVVMGDDFVSGCGVVVGVVGMDILEWVDELVDGVDVWMFEVVDDCVLV